MISRAFDEPSAIEGPTIVGAGLGGLVLARVLHVNGIAATIYEAEPSAEARTQGGQIDVHDYNGQLALEAAGLSEQFRAIVHEGGEASRVLDQNAGILLDEADDGTGSRPEVMRGALRQILLDSLPAETIKWGHKIIDIAPVGDGVHRLLLADGSTVTTDLLVGADGAWSKVRPLITDAKPHYTGMSFIETNLHDVDRRHTPTAAALGDGSYLAVVPGKGIVGHRETGEVLHAYVALTKPQEWVDTLDLNDTTAVTAQVAGEFDGWAPQLTALITDSDTDPVPRPVNMLPIGLSWEHVKGVTILGDAAHLMSPFAGEGANLAMFDAAELGKAIVAYPDDAEAALIAYEEALFPRSEQFAKDSNDNHELIFGDNAPHGLLDLLTGNKPGEAVKADPEA